MSKPHTKEWVEEEMVEFFREKYPTFSLGSDNLHITSFVREFGIWLVGEMEVKTASNARDSYGGDREDV